MKELNIADMIAMNRRKKGITQEGLAAYLGVSKAAVSKWENGQSYPDITFLPQLATYFNVSVDDLLGYEPQLTDEDIRKLYKELAGRFSREPAELVWKECRDLVKKYYSCFPLLFQIVSLYVNHVALLTDKDKKQQMLDEIINICNHIIADCKDTIITRNTMIMQAFTEIIRNQPEKVFEILGEEVPLLQPDAEIIAQAYNMLGNQDKALETLQISAYQNLLFLLSAMTQLMNLNAGCPDKMRQILDRCMQIIDTFEMETLHPNTTLGIYLLAAQILAMNQDKEQSLKMLHKYVDNVNHIENFELHGDDFFERVEDWIDKNALGGGAPRDISAIKQSILQQVELNPAFTTIKEDPEFIQIVHKLKHWVEK